jgi:hypothetical protein
MTMFLDNSWIGSRIGLHFTFKWFHILRSIWGIIWKLFTLLLLRWKQRKQNCNLHIMILSFYHIISEMIVTPIKLEDQWIYIFLDLHIMGRMAELYLSLFYHLNTRLFFLFLFKYHSMSWNGFLFVTRKSRALLR